MQDCFRAHPDVYAAELEDDEEEGAELPDVKVDVAAAKEEVQDKAKEGAETMKEYAKEGEKGLAQAKEIARKEFEAAKDKVGDAPEAVKDKVGDAPEAVKDAVPAVTKKIESTVERAAYSATEAAEDKITANVGEIKNIGPKETK